MAELKELLFAINDIRRGDLSDDNAYQHGKSIFSKAKPVIMNFPVIVSDLISLEDLTMINKALEREYATVTRLAMGLDDIIDDNDSRINNKISYIKKFHTNDYTSPDRNYSEILAENSINLIESKDEETDDFSKSETICESLGLNMRNINDMTLSEAKIETNMRRTTTTTTTKKGNDSTSVTTVNRNDDREEDRKNIDSTTKSTFDTITQYNSYDKQLLDNDVKKANELIPTTVDITVYQKCGQETITEHILLGIKATAHKVKSEDMINNITQTIEQKKSFFRFIRWTTGEIKFFKDYLLCLDFLKKEALETRAKDSSMKWFRGLKNRSLISKIKQNFRLKDQLIPNCTLVITMDEVDYIRNTFNIDLLRNVQLVDKLMSVYFLIGFVIVDPSSEIAHFKFDGFDRYQTFSYRALERENRNQGNDIKSLVSIMGSRF